MENPESSNTILPQPPKKSRIKRALRNIFLLIFSLIVLLIALSYVFENKIKNIVVGEINKQIQVEVAVKDIHFSFIRKFPYASLRFDELLAHPSKPFNKKDTLLYAKKFFLMFNLMDAISGKYELKKVELNEGVLNLLTNTKGEKNFDILKKSTSDNSDIKLNIQNVKLKNIAVNFQNQTTKQFYQLTAEQSNLSGNFSAQQFVLNCTGDLTVYRCQVGKSDYIRGKKTKLDLHLDVDNLHEKYTLKKSSLQIEEMKLLVDGDIKSLNEKTFIALKLKADKANIISLLTILPNTLTERLKEFDVKGELSFDATINGFSGGDEIPLINVLFSTKNSELTPPQSSYTMRNIGFDASYTNRKSVTNKNGFLSLKNFHGNLEGNAIRANFEIENFQKPTISLQADASIDLKQLRDFFKADTIQSIYGSLKINADFKGTLDDATTYVSTGTAQLTNAEIKLKNSPTEFKNINGIFSLKDNEMQVTSLQANINSSDVRINGVITNVIGFLFLKNDNISIDADIHSNKINLDEIIITQNHSNDSSGGIHFSPAVTCNLTMSVAEINYKKFSATQLRGNMLLQDAVLNTNELNFKAFDGSITLDGAIDASRIDSILISSDTRFKNINITKLFEQTGSFGQKVLTEKNIRGVVDADVQFASIWSRQLMVNEKSIYAKCNVIIKDGELLNLEAMQKLAKFVKGSDLNDVKFDTLKNTIEIKNRIINIPTMEIRSSAKNLFASGTHSFDGDVDYKIKIQLSQLLGKKVKDQNTEFGTIEEDGYGRPNIYLTMHGKMSNPKITYDSKAVSKNMEQNMKQEKQTMKTVLNKEFGWFKKDTVVTKPKDQKKKKEELQIDLDDEGK